MIFTVLRTAAFTVVVSFLGSMFFLSATEMSSFAEDEGGVPIAVQVVAPTTAPSPRPVSPVAIPVDVPISEVRIPISLSGLEPHSYVEIFANSTPILIASGFADSQGVFEVTVSLPPNLPVGNHTISATNTLSDGSKVSTVAAAFSVTSSGRIAPAGVTEENLESARARSASIGNGTSSETSVTDETVTGSAATLELGPDPFNLGGVFYLGGLVAKATYPKNIMTPTGVISFSIRNVSNEIVSGEIVFSVHNIFGVRVSQEARYFLRDFGPGQTRHVTGIINNIGQWGTYTTHMKFTPPQQVGGNELTPIELTTSFVALPAWILFWALVILLAVGGYFLGMRKLKWPSPLVIYSHIHHFFESRKPPFDEAEDDDDSFHPDSLQDLVSSNKGK
jgi:hypothetical protein